MLVGVLRHYVTMLLNSAPKKQPIAVVREQYVSSRSHLRYPFQSSLSRGDPSRTELRSGAVAARPQEDGPKTDGTDAP